jgi:hypothetical protein
MVNEFKFHDIVLDLFNMRGVKQYLHSGLGRGLAGRNQRWPAVFYANQTHPAIAVGAERRVVTEVWNLDADGSDGVDQVFPR